MIKLGFLTSGFIIASLKVFGTYPSNKGELMRLRRGSMTSGRISFSSLGGIGTNTQVVNLDELTSLQDSSSPIATNEYIFSSGSLRCIPWSDTVVNGS